VRHAAASDRAFLPALSTLYGVNTLGAALGAGLSGFVLFEALGIFRTGAAAIRIARACGALPPALDRPPTPPPPRPPGADDPSPGARAAILCASLGGAAALGYEVLWTRLLAVPLRSYSYSFSLMLALFLAGIVLGAIAIAIIGERIRDPLGVLGIIQVA